MYVRIGGLISNLITINLYVFTWIMLTICLHQSINIKAVKLRFLQSHVFFKLETKNLVIGGSYKYNWRGGRSSFNYGSCLWIMQFHFVESYWSKLFDRRTWRKEWMNIFMGHQNQPCNLSSTAKGLGLFHMRWTIYYS